MKKAVLYARVSSAMQEKERTIESQIEELKRQISNNGDVLVKEYVDDGYSGAQLERPALDELRKDLKTDLFDTIYFLCADRIARDVAYQTIIIAEILKYKKQIIIGGKDYVHNPENKFALTVLGAVAELERAKIVERSQRGKLHKLRQGLVMNNGSNIYGYDYVRRSGDAPAKVVVNEKEAAAVRYIFNEYAEGASWSRLIRGLEEMGAVTKMGKKLWDTERLTKMLKNQTYTGIKYFNTRSCAKLSVNPLHKVKYGKKIWKDRSEWIGIMVPTLVSREIFDKVQTRFEKNREAYRKPHETQLLSGLLECGACGHRLTAYQRYCRRKRSSGGPDRIVHKVAYVCVERAKSVMHAKKYREGICRNPEVSSRLLEPCVWKMIECTMLDPAKLLQCTDYAKSESKTTRKRLEKKLKDMDERISKITEDKRHLLEDYAEGKIDRREYAEECLKYDREAEEMKKKKNALVKSVPALHKKQVVEESVRRFCDGTKMRFEQCDDLESKRRFLLDYMGTVTYLDKNVSLRGSIPVALPAYDDPDQPSEAGRIGFCIEGKINRRNK